MESNTAAKSEPFILDGRKMQQKNSVSIKEYHMRQRSKLRSKFLWHKFTILKSAHIPKEKLLRHFLEILMTSEILPVKYHTAGDDSVFYVKDCQPAVDLLLRANFMIPSVESNMKELVLTLEINTSDVVNIPNPASLISSRILERFNSSSGCLNLSNFHNDSEIEPNFFYPLSTYKVSHEVFQFINSNTSLTQNLSSVKLSYNQLTNLEQLKAILYTCPNVNALDLRSNDLEISALEALSEHTLKELFLDGNPLCDMFDTEMQYVSEIRKLFPHLEWLDGVRICNEGPPRLQRFFLCNPLGKQLVEQFVEHYFSLYDSQHRKMLLGTYRADAKLSITAFYLPAQTTSANARLSSYIMENRNLLRLSDYSKINKLLQTGNKSIVDLLCKLPSTEHDASSFTAELLYYSVNLALVSVTGLFREPANPSNSVRYFKRQFVLQLASNNTYYIINELISITNCTTTQAQMAFLNKPETPPSPLKTMLTTRKIPKLRKEEKKDMIITVSDLTEMNRRWSKKCLVDVKWDIRSALILFNDNYKDGKIPGEAFIK